MSIHWYRDLYVGESAREKLDKIRWKVQHYAGDLRIYLITMPTNEDNSLDILHEAHLKQSYYKKKDIYVVGVALSYEEALQVVTNIVEEVYTKTKGADIKAYLRSGQDNEKWQV